MDPSSDDALTPSPSTPDTLPTPAGSGSSLPALLPDSTKSSKLEFPLGTSILSEAVSAARTGLKEENHVSVRLHATKAVIEMFKANHTVDEAHDKRERLDSGKPTEIASTGPALEAAANRLFSQISGILGGSGPEAEVIDVTPADTEPPRLLEDRAEDSHADPQADGDAGSILG